MPLPEIRTEPINLTLHGHDLIHNPARRYSQEIISLLNRVWPILKSHNIPNDGINRIVYEHGGTVFAGVVLNPGADSLPAAAVAAVGGLEQKQIHLTRYAYWKHIGPYHLIPNTCAAMTKSLEAQGIRQSWPMLEVYGRWTNDESKLETETFVAVI
ncbi:MAG: hypothetical protein U0573_05305 [Phycisphaerales bacterium]|nr:hypothetical protein [Planctomycetota bacterium]